MSLLPTIVSILTFNLRKNRQEEQNDDLNEKDGRPADHRIDIPSPDARNENGTPSSLDKLTNEGPRRRKPRQYMILHFRPKASAEF